jgi:hypothetical protein
VDVRSAHVGLAVAVVVSVLVAVVWSATAALVMGGILGAVFAVALGVALVRGRRGRDAVRAAYKAAFGWAGWF